MDKRAPRPSWACLMPPSAAPHRVLQLEPEDQRLKTSMHVRQGVHLARCRLATSGTLVSSGVANGLRDRASCRLLTDFDLWARMVTDARIVGIGRQAVRDGPLHSQ